MNTVIIILFISIFVITLWHWKMKYGMQDSISDYFRVMQKEHGKGSLRPWKFWGWLAVLGALFHAYFLNGWSFLTMGLLLLVGAAAEYWKSKHVEIPHIVGATGGIIAGYTTVIIHAAQAGHSMTGVMGFLIGAAGAFIIERDDDLEIKHKTYWIEVIQFLMIVVIITLTDFVWN